MKHNLIALGSDPELFLLDEEGVNVPSEHYFQGDKDNPPGTCCRNYQCIFDGRTGRQRGAIAC